MKRIAGAILLAVSLLGLGPVATAVATTPESVVIPPQQENYGQLGMLWWRWALSIPAAQNPILDTSGADCAVAQKGGTWFLAGTPGGAPVTRSCTIPAGKKIFFPVIALENDYPCPDTTFQPAPGQSLKDFLTFGTGTIPGAVTLIDQVSNLQVSLDGHDIPVLSSYRGTSNMYSFAGNLAGDPNLQQAFDPCLTGSQQKAVSDGYWLLLAPLSPGQHTLRFGADSWTPGFPQAGTYDLSVQ
jgi:hypothetical protein